MTNTKQPNNIGFIERANVQEPLKIERVIIVSTTALETQPMSLISTVSRAHRAVVIKTSQIELTKRADR
jgi:hypothetical protein